MKNWKVELTAGKKIARVKIQRDIFQGDALSPSLFVIAMILLNHILRKSTEALQIYKITRKDSAPKVHGRQQTKK